VKHLHLYRPKPPRPFHPSLDQLQVSARAKDEDIERRLRGGKRVPLPDRLPVEDEAEVDALLTKRGVVSKFAREQVTDKDISRLRPGQWLNDEIINFYGQLIMSRSEGCKENPGVNGVNGVGGKKALNVHYFSTFFWSKLKGEGYEKGRLAKWTKKASLSL
jgi:sentrin-specific protease 1